jgi:hypothetical protein
MAQIFETREEWLQAAAAEMRGALVDRARLTVPEVRIGVGWPSGGMRTKTGGQTWARKASADGINEITIRVDVNDATDVLCILGHELIHAALDCHGGHGKMFQRAFGLMGYVNDPKASVPGAGLREEYETLARALGDYPSADGLAIAARKKKQTTRMIKCECVACGFIFRTTAKWADGSRALRCPDYDCGGAVDVHNGGDGDDGEEG